MFEGLKVQTLHDAMIYFSFGQQHLPFMQFLRTLLGSLLTGMLFGLALRTLTLAFRLLTRAALFQLLRFEANFQSALFGSKL